MADNTTTEQSVETDGRKTGLSTQGYPLRKIVDRSNRIHTLACGHKLPKPEPDSYDLRKSRRCVECGPAQSATAALTVESALAELREMFPGWHCEISVTRYLGKKSQRAYTRFDVHCTDFEQNDFTEYGPTLNEAMEQVRQWHAEQAKR